MNERDTALKHNDQRSWKHLIELAPASGLPLQLQIRQGILAAIRSKRLPVGTRIPATRILAEALGVARNTVVLAIQPLVSDRILEARDRSGFFVADHQLGQVEPAPRIATDSAAEIWTGHVQIRPTQQRNIAKPANWRDYDFPFVYGQSDQTLFPTADWRDCARAALSVLEIQGWAQDLIDGDYQPLIEQLRINILPRRGIWPSPDEIILTLGAQHALFLTASLLGGPNRELAFEDPGYPDARNIFSVLGTKIVPIPVDDDGIVADMIPKSSSLVCVTPSNQCPTGTILSPERQRTLLEMAQADDKIIIEDDYGVELLGDPTLPRALKSADQNGRVVYIGSLSKILAPGLRLGYIVAAAPLIRELRALRRLMLRHPPANNQHVTSLFISLGYADVHLRKFNDALHARSKVLLKSMKARLPDWTVKGSAPMSSLWVEAPAEIDTNHLAEVARNLGVVIEPGGIFYSDPNGPKNFFRMGFASIPANHIDAGIRALSEAAAALR